MADPILDPAGKVVDFVAVREKAGKYKAPKEKTPKQKTTELRNKSAAKASKGRTEKADCVAPDKAKLPSRQSKLAPENAASKSAGGSRACRAGTACNTP